LPPDTVVLNDEAAREYGLRRNVLSPLETLAQSVSAMAPTTSPAMTIPLVFALAGNGTWLVYILATAAVTLIAVLIGCFAPRSASPGSLYTYSIGLLPHWAASLAGWALLLAYVATGCSTAGGFIHYANVLLQAATGRELSAVLWVIVVVLGSAVMAYRDIRLSTRAMLWMEAASVACIAMIVVVVLWKHGAHLDMEQMRLRGASVSGMRLGLVLALFSFVGFESATALGEEAREPLKTIPRVLLQCVLVLGALFMVSAYAEVLGFHGSAVTLDKSPSPFHLLAAQAGAPVLGLLVDVGAMVSMFACTLACITAAARVLLLMSHHGLTHVALTRTHRRNETPHIAVIAVSAAMLLMTAIMAARGVASADIYGWMGSLAVYGFLTAYALVCVAVPGFLKRVGALTPLWAVLAGLGVLAILLALAGTLYPVPEAPYSWLPYIFLAYLAAGLGWSLRPGNKLVRG
jgi:amino acid transporter